MQGVTSALDSCLQISLKGKTCPALFENAKRAHSLQLATGNFNTVPGCMAHVMNRGRRYEFFRRKKKFPIPDLWLLMFEKYGKRYTMPIISAKVSFYFYPPPQKIPAGRAGVNHNRHQGGLDPMGIEYERKM